MKRFAFTIIELLVVVSIIAVLSSLLFPVLVRAKERAKQTTSSSNLRQLALATILYADDSDQVLPFYRNNEFILISLDPEVTSSGLPTNSKQPMQLVDCLAPYARSNTIWFLDSDVNRGRAVMFGDINHVYSSFEYIALPFGFNIDKETSFPLVTRLESLHESGVLFSEPVSKTTPLRTYWSSNVVQSVHADTHVSIFNIPQN